MENQYALAAAERAAVYKTIFTRRDVRGQFLPQPVPDEVLARMDEWNTRTHGGSGLTQRVKDSTTSMAEAEAQTIAFLEQWVPKGKSPICGNSICQDRRFLYTHMKALESYFHYRNLDVSTLKELVARWAPEVRDSLVKKGTHLALDDIRESIAELQHYRKHFIKF